MTFAAFQTSLFIRRRFFQRPASPSVKGRIRRDHFAVLCQTAKRTMGRTASALGAGGSFVDPGTALPLMIGSIDVHIRFRVSADPAGLGGDLAAAALYRSDLKVMVLGIRLPYMWPQRSCS